MYSPAMSTPTFDRHVRSPEFPANLDWLFVSRPPTLADLKGKVVLIDFWTYG